MSLLRKYSTRPYLALLAIMLGLAIPAAASAEHDHHFGFFFWWWLRPPATPVADSTFTLTATRGRLYDVFFLNNVFDSYDEIHFPDVTSISATVTSGQITIAEVDLDDGNGTTVKVTIPASIDLVQDIFGSTFYSTVTIDVTTPSGSYSTTGRIYGKISEESGNPGTYDLRASISGLSYEDLGSGSVVYHLIRTTLSGTGTAP